MAVATYTKSGANATTPAKLDKAVFGVEIKSHELLKRNYLAHLANGRDNLAVAKKRGEVAGGGSKPWRQKGTGRARFGSSRNPIWRGGGVAFGPTGNENYSHKVNTKAKHTALRQALTLAATENRIKIIETFESKDGKVKPTLQLLNKIDAKGSVLLVVSVKDDLVKRATNNLPNVKAVQAGYVHVYDIMNADVVVISKKALDMITERLTANSSQLTARATTRSDT